MQGFYENERVKKGGLRWPFAWIFFSLFPPKKVHKKLMVKLLARYSTVNLVSEVVTLPLCVWKQMVNAPHTARGAVKEGGIEHPR